MAVGTYRCPPPADTTDDHTLLWLLNHIRLGIPELIVQVRHHKHTRAYAFFVTATYERCVCSHPHPSPLPPPPPPAPPAQPQPHPLSAVCCVGPMRSGCGNR